MTRERLAGHRAIGRERIGQTKGTSVKIAVILFSVILAYSGCSSTLELTSVADANKEIGKGSATVLLKSGQEYDGREVDARADSTRFVDSKAGTTLQFPTGEIRSIRVVHRGGGAIEGLLFGGLGAGALGLALTAGMKTGGDEGMGKGLVVLTSFVVGGAGGIVFGVIKGHDYTFVFPDDSVASGWSQSPH